MTRRVAIVAVAVAVLAVVGAYAVTRRDTPSTDRASGGHFVAGPPLATERCPGAAAPSEGGTPRRIEVQLLRGRGVTDGELRELGGRTGAYLRAYGVALDEVGPVQTMPIDELLDATPEAVDEALASAGLADAPEDDPRVRDVVRAEVMGPARTLLRDLGPGSSRVRIVVLRRIASPRSVARRSLPHLSGLTLSPYGTPDDALSRFLDLPALRAPVVLVSLADVHAAGLVARATTIPHELGHAAGLPHVDVAGDLMRPGPTPCLPGITSAQLDRLAARLAPTPRGR